MTPEWTASFRLVTVLMAVALSGCQHPNEVAQSASSLAAWMNPAAQSLRQQYEIPGMVIAVTQNGQHEVYAYGVASKETQSPVTADTLFEIGSISKTFTATLATYAARQQALSLADTVGDHVPALKGHAFAQTSLLNLATHTTGGLPQQVPEHVRTTQEVMAYFQDWRPQTQAGTSRTYSNLSIGLLGFVTA